ncbi:MAG: GWxTD domain-containing protein [Bacteroidales bacterium]|nr:GWxTD domain-containing protein [Bacteroidales bacterium]
MKKLFAIFLALILATPLLADIPRFVQAQLFYSKFYSPEVGPYIETYLSVVGSSIEWVKDNDGKFQGKIEVTMIFKDQDKIVTFDKYELLSPKIADTADRYFNFLDQQRFALPNGVYDFEIKIQDMNTSSPPFSAIQSIDLNFTADEISISGIQLIESFNKTSEPNILSKSGYDLVPYVYNFIPQDVNILSFYSEVYNSDKIIGQDEKFLLSYFIESYETKRRMEKFVSFKRENTNPVIVLFANYNIAELPSGNYNLVVEVRNKDNALLTSNKLFFQRSNPNLKVDYTHFAGLTVENSFVAQITSRDTLMEYINYLYPISTDMESKFVKHQIKESNADLAMMQRFFLNFWLERDELNPENAWTHYLGAVQLVNEQFGAPGTKGKKGYQTDMGYVFLKYGPPNTITDRPFDASTSGMTINSGGSEGNDAGSVPYQIWHYYALNNLRDRKFVFANTNLALFDYKLIHSNMPGEIQNENWQAELHYRFKFDSTMPETDKYKGKSGDYYNNPR